MTRSEQLITDHPLIAVVGAFSLGAGLGLFRPRGRIGRAIAAAVGGIASTAVRHVALRTVTDYAKHWSDNRDRETRTSYEPAVETMFEH